jgi:hypothetical protein
VNKDVKIHGYFPKPKGIHEQNVWEALLFTFSEWVEEVRQKKKEIIFIAGNIMAEKIT